MWTGLERRVRRARRSTTVAFAAGVLLLGACEAQIRANVDVARAAAGAPIAKASLYLDEAARSNSAEMCAAGTATPSLDPLIDYGGETAVAIDELVASAPLDPSIADGVERNLAATDAVWAEWAAEPTLTAVRWDEYGVGERSCPDGNLYLTLLLRENPTMPGSGRYSTPIFPSGEVDVLSGLVYGSAIDHRGVTIDLLLDLYVPPDDEITERPLILFVHGGGFSGGSRSSFATHAMNYARRGFVVASIDYRLRPNDTPAEQLVAALQAIDDAMESVRWLKANAPTYGIDPDRIAALGSSAGGAIVLGVGHAADLTPGGPLSGYSPTVTAVVSTGAHLTPGLAVIDFEPTDAPSMMFHYEQDTSQGQATWDYAYQTCAAIRDAGPPCDFIKQPGSGHTIPMGPTSQWWVPEIGPFVWHHLGLAG